MTDSGDGSADPTPPAPGIAVALSSASVYPEPAGGAFELADRLGYDAVEVMVGLDPASQDIDAIEHLADYYQMPVCAVHAPCLLITQRVWGRDFWGKLQRSAQMARRLGARTVVVHPPFRWQRDYAKTFVSGIRALEDETGLAFAVENMYPWRASRRELEAYAPGWNPVGHDYANVTLDLSHTSTAGADASQMARELGPRLRHLHVTDGSGSAKDEHLLPGHGDQSVGELLEMLAGRGFSGGVVVEVNTRRAPSRAARQADLAEALAFTRRHLAVAGASAAGAAGTGRDHGG